MTTGTTEDIVWLLLCTVLVAMMQPGFMCLESGLTRNKNSINVAIKNLADFGTSILLFWAFGYALMFGTSWAGWFGHTGFFFSPAEDDLYTSTYFLFQAMFCGTAVTIISGAVAERVRFINYLFIAVLTSSLIYPISGHWVWGEGGWLQNLGFIDFAGSTVVHSIGGWVALAILLIIGPRQGRFVPNKPPRTIHGHSMPLAILGTLLLWVGWFGFNGGSVLAFDSAIGGILINTALAGCAGMLVALLIDWIHAKTARVEALMNGCLAGLVAITANCHIVSPIAAVAIGGMGGIVMVIVSRLLEHWHIDDAVGAIPVHTAAGIWGTLAVALFAPSSAFAEGVMWHQQLGIQFIGVLVCGIWAFGIAFLILSTLNLIAPLRISLEQEDLGLNISEHGASTELHDLLTAMEAQATSGDLKKRVHEEAFTDVGKIAHQYNRVLERLGHETETTNQMADMAYAARQEAEQANQRLQEKLEELQDFNRMTTGRELKMIELKKEINTLRKQLGLTERYILDSQPSNYQSTLND